MDERIRVADSITKLASELRGAVLVAGSHGGCYCGYLAAAGGLAGVVLNDAGVGKDDAGVGALTYLEPLGIPAATVAHDSARIGDGADMLARGVLSHCNGPASVLGCFPGQPCREAAARMLAGPAVPAGDEPPAYAEARTVLRPEPRLVIGCDSASLVTAEDTGRVVVTGSHGGLLAGRPGYGLAARVRGAVFNDAGVGIDDAGIGRLALLAEQGMAAVTVAAASARIGDARSAWETGVISYVNRLAAAAGVARGMSVPDFADRLLDAGSAQST